MNQSVKLLKHLTDVNGIAGYEMQVKEAMRNYIAVSYTHLRAHETSAHLVCRLLLEKR
ncbi:hypothetical protein JMUB7540_28310 [Staphylococcus aureus]